MIASRFLSWNAFAQPSRSLRIAVSSADPARAGANELDANAAINASKRTNLFIAAPSQGTISIKDEALNTEKRREIGDQGCGACGASRVENAERSAGGRQCGALDHVPAAFA